MASLKDIAEKTGLSMNTVSRAIRKSGYVSERAQKLVDAAAAELNYQPNRAAQSLRASKSFEIAVINLIYNPSLPCDSMSMDKIHGIKEYLSSVSYDPNIHYLYSAPEYREETEKQFMNILRRSPAGVIFLTEGETAEKLYNMSEKSKIPAILISGVGSAEFDSVYVDRQQGVGDAVRYLLRKGCKNIIYSGYKKGARLLGYQSVLKEAGCSPKVVEPEGYGFGQYEEFYNVGANTALNILDKYPETDAVIAYSDYLASGIAAGFQKAGKKVPDDIAVVGFDNRELAMFSTPPLTTIAQPNRELGRKIAEALLTKVNQSDRSKRIKIRVKMDLIIRKSA